MNEMDPALWLVARLKEPWASAWAAVLTASIYAVIASRQLRAMQRQTDVTERSISAIERPWLIVTVDTPAPFRPEKTNMAFPRNVAAMG